MKINYYQQSLQTLAELDPSQGKPTLLLHACCGPCAIWPIEFLLPYFQITILYNNSNIYPQTEYQRRLEELQRYLKRRNQTLDQPIELIVPPYDNAAYTAKLAPLKDEPERGKRCWLCYRLRIQEALRYAADHGFSYMTTVMTISRQKDSQVLNEIGAQLAQDFPSVRYFHSDFKKADGILKANALIRENHMYRQDYCGCVYSWTIRQAQKKVQGKLD